MTESKVRLPRTINSATKRLADLDGIANATGWERSAIVWAFTHEHKQGQNRCGSCSELSMSEQKFAGQGIVGLKSRNSVKLYRDAWKMAVAAGEAQDVKPGQAITLPTMEFPAMRTGTDGYDSEEGAEKTIQKIVAKHGPKVVARTIIKTPQGAQAAAEELPDAALGTAIREGSKRSHARHQAQRAEELESMTPAERREAEKTDEALAVLAGMGEEMMADTKEAIAAHSLSPAVNRLVNHATSTPAIYLLLRKNGIPTDEESVVQENIDSERRYLDLIEMLMQGGELTADDKTFMQEQGIAL